MYRKSATLKLISTTHETRLIQFICSKAAFDTA